MKKRLINSIATGTGSLEVKTYKDTEWNEYVCQLYISGRHYKRADYHTTDKQDALSTANHMLELAVKKSDATNATLEKLGV